MRKRHVSTHKRTRNYFSCGSIITQFTNLTLDIGPCIGSSNNNSTKANSSANLDGITIGADNITLNCNGHTNIGSRNISNLLSPRSGPYGIKQARHSGVTIANCKVMGFDVGIFVDKGTHNKQTGNTAMNSSLDNGFDLGTNDILTGNTIANNR